MSAFSRKARFPSVITKPTRRVFLADSCRAASAAWLALELPWVATLASCAREDARSGRPFVALTLARARAMRAFAGQIIPSGDGAPGADEAGAVHFVDRALGRPPFAESAPIIQSGLDDLDARARAVDGRADFAALPDAQQIAVMRKIEHEPFFTTARLLVILGTFADPKYGGNVDGVGWTMLGIDHRPSYTAPFGWYDAQGIADSATGAGAGAGAR
jgi:gluconate 2-dehydrogenase gamma chain